MGFGARLKANRGWMIMDSTTQQAAGMRDPVSDLTGNFSETIQAVFSAGSVEDTLAKVVSLAVATIEGCDYAGLFVNQGGHITTPAHSEKIVIEIDALQHKYAEGPCLDAIKDALMIYAHDLMHDERWLRFAGDATATGIRSVLALPLAPKANPGALNLYARYPDAFGVVDRAKGVILASLTNFALSVAHSNEDKMRRVDQLQTGLITREVIGQAQGILMEREKITSGQAFDILRRASQHLNLKLREVAQNLIDAGESPDTGPA
jgi:hypothetical protein